MPRPISPRPRRCIAALLAATVAIAPLARAQQNLPDLGDPSQVALSGPQERKLGESVMRDIRLSGGYLNDPEVNGYLNDLGNRLVTAIPGAPFDFEFFAVNDPSINAFALPGVFVGVNTGLILMTQTESELASVLAHEISHVTQHHIARGIAKQKDAMLASLAALAAAILASRSGGSNSGQLAEGAIASAQGIAMQMQINFTRQNEQEADRIGFQRLDAAGFDVTAMATMMERLQRASRFVEGNTPSYLRDHPVTYERIADAQARAEGKPFRQVKDSLDFSLVRALIRSYQGSAREAILFFDDAIAEKRYNDSIAARYGLVASLLRAENFKRALAEVTTLQKVAPPHPMIEAIFGQVLMQSGQLDAAIARYEAALSRYPGKMQLVYDYPEALLKNKQPAKAAAFVSDQLQHYPNDGPLHLLAARAYAALGKPLLEHQHQGEYYAWQGNLPGAIVQLELAAKSRDATFYEASAVESRLRALRQELDDQKKRAGDARSG
ncbi:MAG: beta-barrel assembly-enhancing protease [Casimicrobiaceae bacterium]